MNINIAAVRSLMALMMFGLASSSCKPVKTNAARSKALEEDHRLLSGKINRVYLAFRDTTPNKVLPPLKSDYSDAFKKLTSDGNSVFRSLIRLRPFFLVMGHQNISPSDQNWPSRYEFDQNIYEDMASNAPIFYKGSNAPALDSSEPSSLDFTIVGCYNEDSFDEYSKNIFGQEQYNTKDRPLYKYNNEDLNNAASLNLGHASSPFQLKGAEKGMPYNERLRLADFPIIPSEADFTKDKQCKVIGYDFQYNAPGYLNAMKDYSGTLGPKFNDFLGAGLSTLACGLMVGGHSLI